MKYTLLFLVSYQLFNANEYFIIDTMNPKTNAEKVFQIILRKRKMIISVFYGQNLFMAFLTGYASFLTSQQTNRGMVYEWGETSGTISLVFFCLSIFPGILRRFGRSSKVTQVLMLFRRQIGVTAFIFGFFHYLAVRMLPILFAGVPVNMNPPLFEIFGFLTLYPMSLLFLTSNDFSVKKMGVWWKRLHSLSYLIVWSLFIHVALQGGETWMYLIGIFAVLESGSLAYFFFKPIVSPMFARSLSEAKK